MRHLRFSFRTILASTALLAGATAAWSSPVATQVTVGNAGTVLFAGTDADGGIDDWYVSNGVVQAVIDDVGPQDDLVPLLGPMICRRPISRLRPHRL